MSSATRHGLPEQPSRESLEHDVAELEAMREPEAATLADLDVRLTVAALNFGRDVAIGVSDPARIDHRWKARRELPDLAATLAAADGDLQQWVADVQPVHREYELLRQDLTRTLAATEMPDAERNARAERLALNMDRWRWMPDQFGERHLWVNIPAFELHAREHGVSVFSMRAVVGKNGGNETPIFSGDMATVVFSPTWNVPERIAREETLPAVQRDPSYLDRQQLDVFRHTRKGLAPVDVEDVDWTAKDEVHGLVFRQRPGPGNALGHVKFLFPNSYDVYLHDTPNGAAFQRTARALSHGCVRVSEPSRLAEYVLRDQASWDAVSIKTAMDAGRERHVKLSQTIPVHIAYFTAWPADDGTVVFFNDVYKYDARQAQSLNEELASRE